MNVNKKIRLFNIYIRPLLYYGLEILELNRGDLDILKRIEGTAIKNIIGIPKKCQLLTQPFYNALNIHTTEDSIHICQYNFLIRAQKNEYVEKFLNEIRLVGNNEGMVSQIVRRLKANANMTEINVAMLRDIAKTN